MKDDSSTVNGQTDDVLISDSEITPEKLIEHLSNTVVLIGLALINEMQSKKKHDTELVSDLDASVQYLAKFVKAVNERSDLERYNK